MAGTEAAVKAATTAATAWVVVEMVVPTRVAEARAAVQAAAWAVTMDRTGRCQHVCARSDVPGSSRRAHLEEEVAAREQQPAGRRGTCARPAARMQL